MTRVINFLKYGTALPVVAALIAAGALAVAPAAQAAVPTSLVLEGFLNSTGGGAAADGDYDVTLSVYNVEKGGSAAWTEGPVKVTVKGGQFTHALGSAKPITAAMLDNLSTGWLGLKIGSDPELPRQALRSVAFALLADTAKKLACSGCVTDGALASGTIAADKLAFPFAGSKTKGGPANIALDVQCTGCISVAELKIDGDLDLGGNALKAKAVSATTVAATSYTGDGSKLTGIKIPSGECKVKGEVVKGINADGTLQCVAALDPSALPADGIDEISNFLIHNQFQNSDCIAAAVPIKDNNPIGVSSELTFGDYGLSQKLDVLIDIKNSDLSTVTIKLWDPNNVEYLLWEKSGPGKALSGVWPSKTKVLKGDLTTWINKNPKGKWRIQVIDGAFLNNGDDGEISKFCVNIQTLSNKKIRVGGNLIVDGDLSVGGNLDIKGKLTINGKAVHAGHFPNGSAPFLYGWIEDHTSANWVYQPQYQYAHQVPIDNRNLHLVAQDIIYGDVYGNWERGHGGINYANQNNERSRQYVIAFIKNNNKSNTTKQICFRWSSHPWGDGNYASLALNKSNLWSYTSNNLSTQCVNVSFPAGKTSTLVLKTGTYMWTTWNGYYGKTVTGFYNDSFKLAGTGLEFDYERYQEWLENK